MKVVVVGAGIVGLATAYELTIAGHEVQVIESQSKVGQGASGGNGAQLSYSYVQPLADPAIWSQLPKLLLQKNSPLRFSPSLNLHQWHWLIEFMKACTKTQSRHGTLELLKLGAHSRLRFDNMMAHLQIPPDSCAYQENGKLVLYRTESSFSSAVKQLEYQDTLGVGGRQFALSGWQTVELEPSLAGTEKSIVGAVHTPSECVVDCQKLSDILFTRLGAMGVRFSMNENVDGLLKRLTRDSQSHDSQTHWVICAGAKSFDLLKSMGTRVPVYPLKGYSVTLPVTPNNQLTLNVTDASRKTVFAPLFSNDFNVIRVAGFAELVGMNLDVDKVKIQALLNATRAVFPNLNVDVEAVKSIGQVAPWAGLRPATPTGIPIVGSLPGLPRNVSVNIGHGALGLTLAFGTAHKLVQTMSTPGEPL
jgi:D-amino-acid dehydrogenase